MKTTSDQLSAPNPSTPEATQPVTKLMRDVTLDGVVVITEADDPHRNWFGEVSDAEEYWSLDERFAHADLIVRAVNSYDDMLAALKAARESLRDQYGINVVPRHRSLADCFAELKQIDAAIQKAEAQ